MNNIAVFWWSFNPPTLAHSRVVEWVLETGNKVDRIILLPSGRRIDKDFWIQQEERELLINEFHKSLLEKNLAVEIDNYFFEGNNWWATTTVQEDTYFKESRDIKAEFIYGSDVIPHMQKWQWNTNWYIEQILSKIFVHRPGYKYINPTDYDIENYRFLEILDLPKVSSSLAKERLQNSLGIDWILTSNIAQLIHENKLYSKEN